MVKSVLSLKSQVVVVASKAGLHVAIPDVLRMPDLDAGTKVLPMRDDLSQHVALVLLDIPADHPLQ